MKKILLQLCGFSALLFITFSICAQFSGWTEVAPGVWKTIVGNPDAPEERDRNTDEEW